MVATTLDTYEAVKTLQSAGVQEDQARAVVALVKQGSGPAPDLLTRQALKSDLDDFERRIEASRNAQMTIFEQRMTIRLGLMMVAAAGLALAAAKLL